MMKNRKKPINLEFFLDSIEKSTQKNEQISWNTILEIFGRTSYGPLLVISGLIILAPVIGDIPGVPTLVALVVLLVTVQLLLRREHLWLPDWLLRRSVSSSKVEKMISWSRPPARFIDRIFKPRLGVFIQGPALYLVAVICAAVALMTPAMEMVPFSANGAGLVLTFFGLSLITRDGLLSLIALISTGIIFGIVIYNLM